MLSLSAAALEANTSPRAEQTTVWPLLVAGKLGLPWETCAGYNITFQSNRKHERAKQKLVSFRHSIFVAPRIGILVSESS